MPHPTKARFELGIALSNQRDYAAAVEAFAMIKDYPGAKEELQRANYNRASACLKWGRFSGPLTCSWSWATMSADYMKQALYAQAQQLLAAGEQAEPWPCSSAWGITRTPASFGRAVYQALAKLNDSDLAGAAEQLKEIPGYKNADELYEGTVYSQAQAMEQAGDHAEAARLYALIPGHEDASTRGEASFDAYYQTAYETAKQGMKDKKYKVVIDALKDLDRQNTGEKYSDIGSMYQEANYLYANELYADNKPYEALVYYRNVLGYKDVAKKLDRASYRVIGSWKTDRGAEFTFRDDGTCLIEGKEMYYFAKNFTLRAGDRPEELNVHYHIVDSREQRMTLRNESTKKLYKFVKVTEDKP